MLQGETNTPDRTKAGRKMNVLGNRNGGSLIEFVIIAPLAFIASLRNRRIRIDSLQSGGHHQCQPGGGKISASSRLRTRLTEAQITTEVLDYCNDLLISFGATETPSVTATHPDGTTLFGDDLQVQVTWHYTFLVLPRFSGSGLSNPSTLSARAIMKYE